MTLKNYFLLFFTILLASCSKTLSIQNTSTSAADKFRTVERNEIKKIKFDPSTYCVAPASEKVILSELESLKSKLINWDSNAVMAHNEMVQMFKHAVLNINKFAAIDNRNIQTDEREWIWCEMNKFGVVLEFEELSDLFDGWREW